MNHWQSGRLVNSYFCPHSSLPQQCVSENGAHSSMWPCIAGSFLSCPCTFYSFSTVLSPLAKADSSQLKNFPLQKHTALLACEARGHLLTLPSYLRENHLSPAFQADCKVVNPSFLDPLQFLHGLKENASRRTWVHLCRFGKSCRRIQKHSLQ